MCRHLALMTLDCQTMHTYPHFFLSMSGMSLFSAFSTITCSGITLVSDPHTALCSLKNPDDLKHQVMSHRDPVWVLVPDASGFSLPLLLHIPQELLQTTGRRLLPAGQQLVESWQDSNLDPCCTNRGSRFEVSNSPFSVTTAVASHNRM